MMAHSKKLDQDWQPASWQQAFDWKGRLPQADQIAVNSAQQRQNNLVKPLGSLGRLEEIAVWLSGWQGGRGPVADKIAIRVFAGNHGIALYGISAFPISVTGQMVDGFKAGIGAINQLSDQLGADLDVIPLGELEPTADSTQSPALTDQQALNAFVIGMNSVPDDLDVLILGEMGIGNTAVSSALFVCLFKEETAQWVGRGTGVDTLALAHKVATVSKIAEYHRKLSDPREILRCVGGHEFAAMAGALIAARMKRIPVILDGFNVSAAAAILWKADHSALAHVLAGHVSAEKAHARALEMMDLEPLLNLDMRLGEGTGAAVAASVLRAAVACHTGMSTFVEAGVSTAS